MNRSLVLFLTLMLLFCVVAQPWSCSPPKLTNGTTTGSSSENDTNKESSGEEKTTGTSKEATVEEPGKVESPSDEKAASTNEQATDQEAQSADSPSTQEPTPPESRPMGPEPVEEPTGAETQEPTQQPEPGPESGLEPGPEPGPELVVDAGSGNESATPEPTQDNSVSDAGSPPESTIPEWINGQPVQAPSQKWTWVDVKGSKCGYGTQTGFGINLNPGAKRAFIFLQGGGGCWTRYDVIGSCFKLVNSSLYLTGFNKSVFAVDAFTLVTLNSFFFKRVKANVFQNDHYVFIPYCTGDVHSGDGTMKSLLGRTMHFHGHKNMKLFLARIVPTLKGVKEVYIAGSSAGGFGAALNWGLVQQAFGNHVKVHLINDSGPPMEPGKGRWNTWVKAWNMAMPPGCPNQCKTDISAIIDHYKKTLMKQGRKMAFLSYDKDAIINTFFGYGDPLGNTFQKGIKGLIKVMDTIFNAEYFILSGRSHTMLLVGPENIKDSKTKVTLPQWIEWMVKDDPSWKGIKP